MEITAKIKNIKINERQVEVTISTYNQTILEELENFRNKNKELSVTIKRKSQKRTKDSNSYLWHLCEEIAKVINSDKDSVYLDMLGKYGVFTHIVVKPNIVDRVKEKWRLVKELGEVTINGNTGTQLQCYFGSSTYTQEEMSRMLKGVVNEAHDLGISTLEDEDLNSMIKEWGVK